MYRPNHNMVKYGDIILPVLENMLMEWHKKYLAMLLYEKSKQKI